MVSVMTTPTVTPSRSRSADRSAAALPSGSTGSSASSVDADIGAVDTRGGLHETRVAFSVIRVRPLRASTRTASASISLRRNASRSSGSAGAATMRPSHLDTTLLVTTTTSSSRSHGAAAAMAAARSSPGRNSGSPGTGQQFDRGADRARPCVGHDVTPARSSPARTISAVAAGSVISSGTDRTSTPSISAWSPSCTSQPSRMPVAGAGAVVRADRFGGARDADHRQAFVGHAAQRLSADDGGVPDHARRRRAQRAADPGDGQDRADAHHRIRRRQQHHVGVSIASVTPGAGGGLLGADERETVCRHLGAVPHPPLLEVDRALLAVVGIGDDDVGFAAVVAGRQQSRAGLPSVAQRLGHLRQRIARAQHLAAHQVGGQIAVAEAEPVRLHAVGGEFLLGVPGFVAMAPAPLGVDAAAEGVHAGVEVRADPHAVHPRVVADIDDSGQFVIRLGPIGAELAEPQQVLHTQQEACAADAADQNRDLHSDRD